MRSINIDLYNIILQGEVWTHSTPPCSRESVHILENYESIVTWVAPKMNADGHSAHIPVICFQNQYWTLSLRMSKWYGALPIACAARFAGRAPRASLTVRRALR